MKKLSPHLILFMILFTSALIVLAVVQSAQAASSAASAQSSVLSDTSWVLSALNGQLPLPGTPVTLQFGADGTASGSDVCNSYSTTYTVKGTGITFGKPGAATMMACPEAVMTQATAYMQALAAANKFEVRSNQLTLLNGRQVLATFVGALQGLSGTTWLVTGYNNGREAVVSVQLGTDINAAFGGSGEVTGNAGCNEYFATYLTSDNAIMVGNIGVTRKFCTTPPGIMEQEAAYLAALQSAVSYTVDGNQMTMRNGADAIAVTMLRTLGADLPTPVPGVPTGRVTAPSGVNVRSGPGSNYPVIGFAPFGAEGEIVGRSADGQWWAASIPLAPGGVGWVSADYVAVSNGADVPVLPAPPVYVPPVATAVPPPPTPLPQPTAIPAPKIEFSASSMTINQGECTTLNWSVENVQAVWVYPQGEPYQQYPRTGQGSEQVCPPNTTTYEMLVLLRDGSTVTQTVTINVVPAAPENPLNGTAWQVTGYNTGGAVSSPIVGTTLTARFDAEQISGNAGCNDYFGPYYVSGTNIAFGPLGASQKSCEDNVMQQERDYLAAIQSAATFRFDGNKLELRRADGALAATYIRLQ